MSTLHNPSSHVVRDTHVTARVMRLVALGVLVHPLALVVLALCIWLLVHMASYACQACNSGGAWSMCGVFSCCGCMIALIVMACLAGAYVGLMLFVGWNGSKSSVPHRRKAE